ncbi:MAG: DUF2130 domain-containing protein [Deltaproteobacteria bacterium]|nr:DUF2130 domain-containing protein [Deltaproteobacteria bacterium]
MADQTIKCPYCSREIPLTETLSNQIKEGVRSEYESKAREKELEFKAREEEINKKNREMEESKKSLEGIIANKLALERTKLVKEAEKRAKDELEIRFKDLEAEKAEKERLLRDAREQELILRKKARELEESKKALDLDMARKLDEEREKIRQSTLEMFSEDHRLKDLEKDKKMNDMLKTIEELKRKAEQGSQQTQGEILELDLEALLKARFPADVIEPVPKGMRGADILQKVYTKNGVYCGAIAWESKRTKAWNDEWLTKLKEDQLDVKAELAVLITEALPKGLTSFTLMEGVWVSSIVLAGSVAEALRAGLVEVAQTRLSAVGKSEKMESVYNYLSGSEFRQKIESIVEAFKSMREDLDHEKRAMIKIWAKREKQIERVVANTLRMYGDMQGIIGASLPEIKSLELGSGESLEEAEN